MQPEREQQPPGDQFQAKAREPRVRFAEQVVLVHPQCACQALLQAPGTQCGTTIDVPSPFQWKQAGEEVEYTGGEKMGTCRVAVKGRDSPPTGLPGGLEGAESRPGALQRGSLEEHMAAEATSRAHAWNLPVCSRGGRQVWWAELSEQKAEQERVCGWGQGRTLWVSAEALTLTQENWSHWRAWAHGGTWLFSGCSEASTEMRTVWRLSLEEMSGLGSVWPTDRETGGGGTGCIQGGADRTCRGPRWTERRVGGQG